MKIKISDKIKLILGTYYKIQLGFLLIILSVRVFEYIAIASKSFSVKNPFLYEIFGLFYDTWACLIYCFIFILPFLLFYLLHKRVAIIFQYFINVIFIINYLSFIFVFSERTRPFDHEFFTRDISESILTTKQFLTGSLTVFLPFIIYITLYFLLCNFLFKRKSIKPVIRYSTFIASVLSVLFIKFSMPNEKWFKQNQAYYLVCNKFSYWASESYRYFTKSDKFSVDGKNKEEIEKQIAFYWKNHPFQFVSTEYPLLHKNTSPDVLGKFLNFKKEKPNIVIVVFEGLSSDFCGDSAVYTSFTLFLDSLAKSSLVWYNHLSTAPGTFGAHPAIEGSLPYGSRGFSRMSFMPDHLSLIKILRKNGYFTYFMTGSGLDFDNLGAYIRFQNTDFMLQKFSSKYKEMGVGPGGWSMGYPDDALYSRSFEVLDSLKHSPYLSIFHTATSHEPYLFVQSPVYDKLFEKKIRSMKASAEVKKTMRQCKKVMMSFMFADDCLKKFFADYKKRPDFQNTIFIITGDHHIGSVPTTDEIDDYHVPFFIYSPMLKKAQRFYCVNSHNCVTPTLLGMLNNNFRMDYNPPEVHWLADVLDTSVAFRNIHNMAFMTWSRDIPDYIWKNYYIYEDKLYQLSSALKEEEIENDTLMKFMVSLRENFKFINMYVCANNKIFPKEKDLLPGEKELLLEINDLKEQAVISKEDRVELMKFYRVPGEYRYLYVDVSLEFYTASKDSDNYPAIQLALLDTTRGNRDYQYSSNKDVTTMVDGTFAPKVWNKILTSDIFNLNEYKASKNLIFTTAIYSNINKIDVKKKNLLIKIYGIK
jgi:lipoteichoic acid synthase